MSRRSGRCAPAAVLIGLLLCTGCVARPPALAVRAAGQHVVMAVVTWNVNAGRGDLRRLLADLREGRLTGSPVSEFVIFLQENIEGGAHDGVAVAREHALSSYFVAVRESDRGISGNAILATRPLLDPHTIDLPRERRVRKAAVATLEIGGSRLFAVCAHLENRLSWLRGALFSDTARGRQAESLVRALPDGPGLLGGDLNTWLGPDEPALHLLLERFDDTPADRLEPTFHDSLVLDRLFFDLPPRWHASHEVVDERYGSDHHPVVGVIIERGATTVGGG
jgi:endonuclease/exonuclease/phosphatase family metal-dependent hydrolase